MSQSDVHAAAGRSFTLGQLLDRYVTGSGATLSIVAHSRDGCPVASSCRLEGTPPEEWWPAVGAARGAHLVDDRRRADPFSTYAMEIHGFLARFGFQGRDGQGDYFDLRSSFAQHVGAADLDTVLEGGCSWTSTAIAKAGSATMSCW